ncbi:Uncharacterised protein [uncultured archaeon]|nr:Uncharacterised protein [uncultured archaeon]
MIDSKRYEEERKRITQKYGTPAKHQEFDPNTSRYLEYRKQEKLRLEKIKNPEKFMPKEPENKVAPEPIIPETAFEEAPKKKSFFSRLFKK